MIKNDIKRKKKVYKKLGLTENASSEQIKESFMALVKKYNPKAQRIILSKEQCMELDKLEERLIEKVNKSIRGIVYKTGFENKLLIKEVKYGLLHIFKKAKKGEIDLKLLNLLNKLTYLDPVNDLDILYTIDPSIKIDFSEKENRHKIV